MQPNPTTNPCSRLFRLGALLTACLGFAAPAAAQFYTAPYGPGGTYNLYEVTNSAATWLAAHNASIAKQAQATGVPGVAGNTITGHLIAIDSWQENSMASLISTRHVNSSNVWIGLTDSDDPILGGAGWVDAGTSPTSGQWFWAGTTGGTGPAGAKRLTDTGHNAFFLGEPNNAGAAPGEDAVELRTDGRWNDNAHNATGTTRRYIIEWEIGSIAPVVGASQISPFYTAPHGTAGGWNLYMMVAEADTWINAHTRAIGTQAQATGLLSMAGNTTKGHLLQVSSRMENSFGVAMANRLLTNNYLIGTNNAISNTWLGLTDTEDAPFAATEAGTLKENNWIWAGTTGGARVTGELSIEETLDSPNTNISQYWANAEPNDSGGANYTFGEDAVELRGDGRWYDLPHKVGVGTNNIVRRYVVEWDINAIGPIAGAESHCFFHTARHGAGNTWNLYYLDYTQLPWQSLPDRLLDPAFGPASATRLPAMTGNTTPGHPIEISDAYEHGSVLRMAYATGMWIGLTDNETYGGQEGFNASNNPANQIQPFWVWTGTNSPATYRRWNAGEPNDSGGNEDAAEMTTAGVFNDNAMNTVGTFRRAMIEWDIQSPTPIAGVEQLDPLLAGTRTLANTPTAGSWAVKTLTGVPPTNFISAVRGANDGPTNGTAVQGTSPVLNFNDRLISTPNGINYPGFGDVGLFSGDLPFIGDAAVVDDNNYITIARTVLNVTAAGEYTFNVHADDNAALKITGAVFTAAYGGGFIDGTTKDTIFNPTGSGDSNLRGTATLAAGTYDVEVLAYESTGGSSLEVSWSPGAHATDESIGAVWTLIGTPATPYPTALLPATIPGAPAAANGQWAIHTVRGAGQLNTLTDALNALGNGAATHTTGAAAVINHSDPAFAATGGMFPGEFTLPSDTANVDDNDFAMHGYAKIVITTAGLYTFGVKHSETVALRIKGQRWLNVGGDFGIDPADPSTVYTIRNSANAVNSTEFTSRGVINLEAGTYEVDFIAFDRDGGFFTEIYSRATPGNVVNTGEYVTGTEGATVTMSNTYRLVGYKNDGTFGIPGVDFWTRAATTPTTSATAPSGWAGTNVVGHDAWFDNVANGQTTDANTFVTINERDPQNPTAATGFPNDRPFWRNGTGDENYYVERFTANLLIPEAGTYSFGWQGDDGGYIEILNLPAGVGFERIEAAAVPGTSLSITANSAGNPNGRLQNQIGGGNTKSMARITFPSDGSLTYPASFPFRSQHFEGTGGSYWEIFAGVSTSYGRPLFLLEGNASATDAPDVNGLQLLSTPTAINVTNITLVDGNRVSFTFDTNTGSLYTIEKSTSLTDAPWDFVTTITATGTSTTYTEPAATLPGQPRLFYRARLVP
ncbi:MAG: uncharacterized protein JWL81_2499 [Verrucomicrobiales bacterium]|nr:uncharacterized protein [Verrucomicrobiales bacterium]